MSSSSSDPASPSEPPPSSGPKPRMTNPGGFDAPTVIDPPEDLPIDVEPLDSNDFERVTLVDLPTIARYDKYELLGRLAYGGMAEIFLATSTPAA